MTLTKARDIFGEEYAAYELHTFPIKDGIGYYIGYEVDDTRKVYNLYHIKLIWDDGATEETTVEGEQELALWTDHLR